jgi:hypothetical protein
MRSNPKQRYKKKVREMDRTKEKNGVCCVARLLNNFSGSRERAAI